MQDRLPFTYIISHVTKKVHYYGVRFCRGCHPSELGVTYFSSSKALKRRIKKYGIQEFKFEVRKVFDSVEKALEWETRFLKKVNAAASINWLNMHNGDGKFLNKGGYKLSEETKNRMRKPKSDSHKKALSNNHARLSGENHPRYGTTFSHTEETKEKISKARKGKNQTPLSQESRQKISESLIGNKYGSGKHELKKVQCPHCGKEGHGPNMSRYHFDKCKVIFLA